MWRVEEWMAMDSLVINNDDLNLCDHFQLGREVLDVAASMIKVGVTCEEIDNAVSCRTNIFSIDDFKGISNFKHYPTYGNLKLIILSCFNDSDWQLHCYTHSQSL